MLPIPRPQFLGIIALGMAGFLFGIAPLHADVVPLKLSYARIGLSNGRVLKNATLNSINRESGLVYVLENERLRPYPATLFPGFVTDAIAQRTAEYPKPTTKSPKPARSHERERVEPAPRPAPENSATEAAARQAAIENAVARKAEQAARNHLRFRQDNGSDYTTVTAAELDLDPPEPVPGWTHRYRVRGNGYTNFYESVGGVFRNRVRGIEILLEAPTASRVKVLEVTTSWSEHR